MKDRNFRKGNDVKWQSHANGNWKHKRGEIVAVIGAGVLPDATKYPGLKVSTRRARSAVSYIVKRFKTGQHYWPHASTLKKV